MPNKTLSWLEEINQQAKEIQSRKEQVEKKIREGFINKTIVFIDVVGSTEFKTRYPDNAEIWILRVKQFSELIASAIEKCNGTVVKYIGDEVMGSFANLNDAKNLVGRISEIEDNLKIGTGFETRIKTSLDYGPVYELAFLNHNAPDPQGTIVDRCARISKFAEAGQVICSADFAEQTSDLNWKKVGSTNLKGLGKQVIYQLGRVTVNIDEKVEIKKVEYEKEKEEIHDLKMENSQLKEKLKHAISQVKISGGETEELEMEEDSSLWDGVQNAIDELTNVIDDAPAYSRDYAKFIFLDHADKGCEEYNKYIGNDFDDLIRLNLIESDDDKYFYLNNSHPRNKKISKLIANLDRELDTYLQYEDQDEDDLFEWSTKDAEFWKKYIRYDVV